MFMRFLFFLVLFLFTTSVVSQSYYEKYNNLSGRYEFYDSKTNVLIGYKTYNSLQKRWETTYVNDNQKSSNKYNETKSSVNTDLLNNALNAKQQRYNYNVQRIKDAVVSINQRIDNNLQPDYELASIVKDKFYKDYVKPLESRNTDYSNDFATNNTINYLNNSLQNMYAELKRMLAEIKNTSNNKSAYTPSPTKTVKSTKEFFPRAQSVVSYAPFFKSPSLSDSERIGTVKDNKVEVLEKYSESVYKVRHGNLTGYMAKLWFNN